MATLRFIDLRIIAYAGINKDTKSKINYPEAISEELLKSQINPENGLVIFFPPEAKYIEAEGDQGVGKTSLANALKEVAGADAPPNAENLEVKDKKIYARFWGKDGNLYDLRITRTGVTLFQIETRDGEVVLSQKGKEGRAEVKRPKEKLNEVVGPTGISPLAIAAKNGKDQVEYVRSVYSVPQDVLKIEADLSKDIKTTYDSRTLVGQKYDLIKGALSVNDYYVNRETWVVWFENNKDFDIKPEDLRKEVDEINEQNNKYQRAQAAFETLKTTQRIAITNQIQALHNSILESNNNIAELEKKIAAEREKIKEFEAQGVIQQEALAAHDKRIADNEKWLSDNKAIVEKHANISKKYEEVNSYQNKKRGYDEMIAKEQEHNHFEDEKQRLTFRLDELRKAKRNAIQSFAPSIEHFEICVPEEGDDREGLYYKKKPISYLSESENWEWFVQFAKGANIQLIIVDNISNLGTESIAKFNEFANNGAYIFGTVMNRKESNLTISFNTKIPE